MLTQSLLPPVARLALRSSCEGRAVRAHEPATGKRMEAYLRPDAAHPIEVQSLRKKSMSLTRLRCDTGLTEISATIPHEDAFVVVLQLRDLDHHELWLGDRAVRVGRYPARGVSILNLEQGPSMFLPDPFDCLHFHITRDALDAFAEDSGAKKVAELTWPHGGVDTVTHHLGMTLLPALQNPDQTSLLFLDYTLFALSAHFLQTYGGMRVPAAVTLGGLAPWQERRSKELISSRLEGEISLAELANECRLSRSHFARAFKKTTGESPHAWLLQRRVQNAKRMLIEGDTAISEIAVACGFADQSHMTKVFSKLAGKTPGAWRRHSRC